MFSVFMCRVIGGVLFIVCGSFIVCFSLNFVGISVYVLKL